MTGNNDVGGIVATAAIQKALLVTDLEKVLQPLVAEAGVHIQIEAPFAFAAGIEVHRFGTLLTESGQKTDIDGRAKIDESSSLLVIVCQEGVLKMNGNHQCLMLVGLGAGGIVVIYAPAREIGIIQARADSKDI